MAENGDSAAQFVQPSFLLDPNNQQGHENIFDDLFFTPDGNMAVVDADNSMRAVISGGPMEGRRGTEGLGFVTSVSYS